MRVAMIQMDMQLGKPEANFEKAEKLVRVAAELKPDVITLPETWNTGFFSERKSERGIGCRSGTDQKAVFQIGERIPCQYNCWFRANCGMRRFIIQPLSLTGTAKW